MTKRCESFLFLVLVGSWHSKHIRYLFTHTHIQTYRIVWFIMVGMYNCGFLVIYREKKKNVDKHIFAWANIRVYPYACVYVCMHYLYSMFFFFDVLLWILFQSSQQWSIKYQQPQYNHFPANDQNTSYRGQINEWMIENFQEQSWMFSLFRFLNIFLLKFIHFHYCKDM